MLKPEPVETPATPAPAPAKSEPLKSEAPSTPSPEVSSNISSDELKNLIANIKAKKEEPLADAPVVPEVKEEAKPEEVKPPEAVKAEEPKVPPAEDKILEMVQKATEAQMAKFMESQKKPETPTEPEMTREQLKGWLAENYEKDPSEAVLKVMESMVNDKLKKSVSEAIKTQVDPVLGKIKPVADKIDADKRSNHLTEAKTTHPEMSFPEFSKKVESMFKNPAYNALVDTWVAMGENPINKMAELVKAQDLPNLIKSAKEAGIKEGEEKIRNTAKTAFAETGGKPTAPKSIDPDKMSADELGKYLPRKVR